VVFCLLVDVVLELRLSLPYVPLRLICGIGGMACTLFLHRLTQEPILILMHLRNLEQMLMLIVLGRRSQPLTAGNSVLIFRILGSRRLVSGSLVITATRSRSERHRCTGRHSREPGRSGGRVVTQHGPLLWHSHPAAASSVSRWIGWSAAGSADDADGPADWRRCRGRLEVR
jgi:hypothetical protein